MKLDQVCDGLVSNTPYFFCSGNDGSTRKRWDPETDLDRQEVENDDDGGDVPFSRTDVTYDDSGDLILQRRPKRLRHSQSMLHLLRLQNGHEYGSMLT